MTNDSQISERELEILRLVATGATNQQIAQRLNISINTVKVHLRNIFGKIGAVSRTEATVYAIRNGLVPAIAVVESPAEVEPALILAEPAAGPAPIAPEASAIPLLAAAPAAEILDLPAAAALPTAVITPRRQGRGLLWAGGGLLAALVVAALLWRLSAAAPAPQAPTAALVAAQADPAGRWSSHAPLPRPRDGFALAAFEAESRLFVIGGTLGGRPIGQIDRFDPQSGAWEALAEKPTPVSGAGAIALRGKIYVPGGEGADGRPLNVFEAYDPQADSWVALAPLPEPRSAYALTVWEGRIYLIGGRGDGQLSAAVLVYDPATNRWSDAPALPAPRQNGAATVVAGNLYLVGGEDAAGPLSEVLRLDLGVGGRWVRLTQMPAAVARPSAITVINALLVFDAAGRAAWQYEPRADAWAPYDLPADAPLAPAASLLTTSVFFVADASADSPGAVGECRVIYNTYVPVRGGAPGP